MAITLTPRNRRYYNNVADNARGCRIDGMTTEDAIETAFGLVDPGDYGLLELLDGDPTREEYLHVRGLIIA